MLLTTRPERQRWPGRAGQRATNEGPLNGARILVVEARYYDDIADALLAGAKRALDAAGVDYDVVDGAGRARNPAGDRASRSMRPAKRKASL